MTNEPQKEPYYNNLKALGYLPFNYSEKHYIFSRDNKVIKIARASYNTPNTDESYYIEKFSHDILISHNFPVVKIDKIYDKGELVDDFVVLEEEKKDGQVFYNKACETTILSQIATFIQQVAQIKSSSFGFIDRYGKSEHTSWTSFLKSLIESANPELKAELLAGFDIVPELTESAFILTDCNTANFIFNHGKLQYAIDIERPLWGDRNFIYGMIKARNQFMYQCVPTEINEELIDYYAKIYKYLFC